MQIFLDFSEIGAETHDEALFDELVVKQKAMFGEIATDIHGSSRKIVDCFIRAARPFGSEKVALEANGLYISEFAVICSAELAKEGDAIAPELAEVVDEVLGLIFGLVKECAVQVFVQRWMRAIILDNIVGIRVV